MLQAPKLNPEEAAAVDRYIAARRRAHAAMAAVDALKPAILQIVSTRQQIARRGALVTPNHSCTCHYSAAVAVMAKSLSEARERERDSGEAKAVVTATVAFEDVRRREAEKRAKATKAR